MHPYFTKSSYLNHPLVEPLWTNKPDLVIVIPAYKEMDLQDCLNHLYKIQNTDIVVSVIVVINYRMEDDEAIKIFSNQQYDLIKAWFNNHSSDAFSGEVLILKELTFKHAGVGLARKIGMDEAAYHLINSNLEHIPIVAFDADCTSSSNYFEKIKEHFELYPKRSAASLYFEHELSELKPLDRKRIASYELHLRCYVNLKRMLGLPFAFQTIGSSMAVRAKDYVAKGGMNKRKAGEDFYFLQKFIEDRRFSEINDLVVYPSSRSSDRVPFGTGRAIENMIQEAQEDFTTYAPQSFIAFKTLVDSLRFLYESNEDELIQFVQGLEEGLRTFLEQQDFLNKIKEVKSNASNFESFQKRFFQWMNAFRFMKYLHFYRDHYAPNVSCLEALNYISSCEGLRFTEIEEGLIYLRLKDRQSQFWKSIS